MSTFRFETSDVPVPLTGWVEQQLVNKVGGCVIGRTGTGKSHAVRKALPAANLYVDVRASDSLLSQRFVADIARQVGIFGTEGKPILEAFRSDGLEASLHEAERAVNGHPFVVDGVDALRASPASLDEPATILLRDEKQTILTWLRDRLSHSPTFLIGGRNVPDVDPQFMRLHRPPESWPIRLIDAPDGYRDWPLLATLANNNPAILTLARTLVPLLPAAEFNSLIEIEQASDDEPTWVVLLHRLGQAFQASAPPSWQKLLSIINTLGEVPRDVLAPLLDGRADMPQATSPYGFLVETLRLLHDEDRSALGILQRRKLVEEHNGRLSVLPALVSARALRSLTESERTQFLPAIAQQLLASVNDPRSLLPDQADRVLRAHSIYVGLGDLNQAERTASLHVHGLVDLARRTSLNEQYAEAYDQYDRIFGMMQSGPWGKQGQVGGRLFSYVRSYRTLNGSLAGRVDNATCLDEYRQALTEWPDNALWHQRIIETLLRLGRPIEAKQAIQEAYEHVAEHPRRDDFLRARPARTALRANLPLVSLEFIEPIIDAASDVDPEAASNCEFVLREWEQGFELDELPFQLAPGIEGRLVFHILEKVQLRKSRGGWNAKLYRLFMEREAPRPRESIEALVVHVATEAKRLISAWTSDLSDKDIRLKGRLLSVVDALNSDIGLQRDTERWIVGRIVGKQLIPTMRELPPVQIPDALLPESTEGLYFVQVSMHRDGIPSGPVMKIEPAGSGRGTRDLVEFLRRMSMDAA